MTRCDVIPVAVEGPACDPRLRRAGGGQASLDFFGDGCAPGQRVLDVGCGRGDHLRSLLARGCEAIGVEPDEQAAERLQEAGVNVVVASAEQLPFPDAMFDAVICSVVVPFTGATTCGSQANISGPVSLDCATFSFITWKGPTDGR